MCVCVCVCVCVLHVYVCGPLKYEKWLYVHKLTYTCALNIVHMHMYVQMQLRSLMGEDRDDQWL